MENSQIQKLKLNATNLKNSLVGYNKQLIKLRKDENNFSSMQEKRKVSSQKEKKIKTKGFFGNIVESAKSKLTESSMSFFDKIKEFFSIIIFGLIINNLPKIISSIEKFFSENKLIFEAIGSTLKIIGDAIMGTIWLVTEYPKSVQQNMMQELDWAGKELNKIGSSLDGALKIWGDFFDVDSDYQNPPSTPTPTPTPTPQSPTSSTPRRRQSSNSGRPTPSNSTNSENRRQTEQHAKGGTIGSSLKPGEKQNSPPSSSSSTPSPTKKTISTPLGRKAIESVDAFGTFLTVTEQLKEQSILLDDKDGINDNFNKVNESFGEFLENLGKKDKPSPTSPSPTSPSPASPSSQSPSGSRNVTTRGMTVDPSDIVGRIGSTGRSTGPHLHIEWGDGYGDSGNRNLSSSILNGVFIDGIPLSRREKGDGLGVRRSAGRSHKGFDYPAESGKPITLGPGLKFVEYSPGYNAGYGNSLIIKDENGQKYLLGHLSAGPSREVLEKIKTNTRPVAPVQPVPRTTPETGGNDGAGGGDLSMNHEITYIITQNTVERQPIPVPYLVRVNNTSSSVSSNPELNPLLLV